MKPTAQLRSNFRVLATTPCCKLHASGRSWSYCSAVTKDGWRWIVDAHREDRLYIVHSDELLSAFLELEAMLL